MDEAAIFLEKALECLAGADTEFANRRYNNSVNRSYYACFQAAIAALLRAGLAAPGTQDGWGHGFVQAQFTGQLVHRRKLYLPGLRSVLVDTMELRRAADYRAVHVGERAAARALRRAQEFVTAVVQVVQRVGEPT